MGEARVDDEAAIGQGGDDRIMGKQVGKRGDGRSSRKQRKGRKMP